MQSPDPNLEMEQHHVKAYRGQKGKGSVMNLPGQDPNFSRTQTSFFQDALKDVNLERPEELDVDDALMVKIYELLDDLKNLKCGAFLTHFWDALKVMFNGYKALIMFALCSLLVVWQDQLQDELVRQKDNAENKSFFKGQIWFVLIIILVFLMKALSAPSSKSFITFSLTVLYYVNLDGKIPEGALYTIIIITDWTLDIIMSTSQVHFAAAKFSRSLFLLLRIYVMVVSIIHPVFFVSWIVFQVAYYLPGGENSLMVQVAYSSPFAIWSIVHMLYKLHCPCFGCCEGLFFAEDHWIWKYLIVDDYYVDECQTVLQQWSLIFKRYQTGHEGQPYSVLHGILRMMKVLGKCNCCLSSKKMMNEDGEEIPWDQLEIHEIWKHEDHALFAFFPAWLWVYTAEFVLMLDSVFLVPYSWFRYYGLLMIAAVTAADIDRFFTVRITMQWLSDGREFDDTVRELLWFKIIKQPFGFLLGCLHVYFLWNKNIRQALYGKDDLSLALKAHSSRAETLRSHDMFGHSETTPNVLPESENLESEREDQRSNNDDSKLEIPLH